MVAWWVKEEEKASEHCNLAEEERSGRREAERVEVAPGVTVASLRRFRAASLSDVDCVDRET